MDNDNNIKWDRRLKSSIIIALGNQRDKRAVPALLKIMNSTNWTWGQRGVAAESLGEIGDPSVLPEIYEYFWDNSFPTEIRSGAITAVAMFHQEKDVFDNLSKILLIMDSSYDIQLTTVKAMAEYGDPRVVPFLSNIIRINGINDLAFWASMSAVKLTDGAISDLNIVKVLKEYHHSEDGVEKYVQEKRDALEKIAKNGLTLRVRIAAKYGSTLYFDIPVGIISIGCNRSTAR